jgi:hypothetical protein
MASDRDYKLFAESNKPPRVTFLRDYHDGKPAPLRRNPHIVQIAITRTPGGGFVVEVGGAPSFVLKASELRFWPTVQHHLEKAIGSPVQRISRRGWAWDLARRGLAPWTAEARQYDEANEEWLEDYCQNHLAWMHAVGAVMARRRADGRRS